MDILDDFIKEVSKILKIEVPEISYIVSQSEADTMKARCAANGSVIYLRRESALCPEDVFAAAHELRHVWQIRYHKDIYIENYQELDEAGREKYNSQPAEVDANAFAGIMLGKFFRLAPMWKGMSAENIERIKARQRELWQEYV